MKCGTFSRACPRTKLYNWKLIRAGQRHVGARAIQEQVGTSAGPHGVVAVESTPGTRDELPTCYERTSKSQGLVFMEDGSSHFRVWAPHAASVAIEVASRMPTPVHQKPPVGEGGAPPAEPGMKADDIPVGKASEVFPMRMPISVTICAHCAAACRPASTLIWSPTTPQFVAARCHLRWQRTANDATARSLLCTLTTLIPVNHPYRSACSSTCGTPLAP